MNSYYKRKSNQTIWAFCHSPAVHLVFKSFQKGMVFYRVGSVSKEKYLCLTHFVDMGASAELLPEMHRSGRWTWFGSGSSANTLMPSRQGTIERTSTLNYTEKLIGSQCRTQSKGVICNLRLTKLDCNFTCLEEF